LWKYNLYDSDSDTKTQSAAPSQDQPDLERQRKFDLLLQYSPSVRDAYAEIAHLPEEFKQRFRAAVLEPGGHHEAKAVGNRLLDEHRKRIRPFDSAEANDFLVKARNLGPAAEKEFMEVMELLGSSASPTEISMALRPFWETRSRCWHSLRSKFHRPCLERKILFARVSNYDPLTRKTNFHDAETLEAFCRRVWEQGRTGTANHSAAGSPKYPCSKR
jgi:hypothetical protein